MVLIVTEPINIDVNQTCSSERKIIYWLQPSVHSNQTHCKRIQCKFIRDIRFILPLANFKPLFSITGGDRIETADGRGGGRAVH